MVKMYTVGHKYQCPPIHAGGLRYHGKAPSLSLLVNKGIVEPMAYAQNEIMEAGVIFSRTEGIIPAPESNHAVKGAIELALRAKQRNEETVILFNLSGHGLLDLKAYDDKLANSLQDYEPDPATIRSGLASVPLVR